MAAFDTAITPVFSSPTNTSNATLFTAGFDTALLVVVTNLTALQVAVKVGVTPSGGSVHWLMFEFAIPANDATDPIGPIFLQDGDAITVQTATANAITFSASGVRSSA